jgi:hypothetical protein
MQKAALITREWVGMDEAEILLGKSQKTVERLAAAGELRSMLEPREGRKPQRVYHAGDLQRIKQENIRSQQPEPKQPRLLAAPAVPNAVATFDVLTKKLWLSLEEAAAYSGFSESALRGMIEQQAVAALKAGPHGAWCIRRKSLEGFAG